MAIAAFRYRWTRPGLIVIMIIEVACALTLAVLGELVIATFFVLLVLAIVVMNLLAIRTMDRAMAARGYRPGSTLQVDWYPDRFTIRTERAHATHMFAEVRRATVSRGTVVIRTQASRLLLLLPEQVVPREALEVLPWQ